MIDWLQVIIILCVTVFVIHTINLNSKYPGPFNLPILGSISLLILVPFQKTHKGTDKHESTYGSFLKLNYTRKDIFVIIDAAIARKILAFPKRAPTLTSVSPGIMDHVLFAMETNDEWHVHRKLLAPGFSPIHLRYSAKAALQCSNNLVNHIKEGKDLDVLSLMSAVALDVIGLFAFGEDVGAVNNPEKASVWTGITGITLVPAAFRIAIPRILWPVFGLGENSKWVVNNRKRVYDYLQNVIDNAKKTKEAKEPIVGLDRSMNIMQRLLQTEDEGRLSKKEVFGEVLRYNINSSLDSLSQGTKLLQALQLLYC
jgi:cytochrome P450